MLTSASIHVLIVAVVLTKVTVLLVIHYDPVVYFSTIFLLNNSKQVRNSEKLWIGEGR